MSRGRARMLAGRRGSRIFVRVTGIIVLSIESHRIGCIGAWDRQQSLAQITTRDRTLLCRAVCPDRFTEPYDTMFRFPVQDRFPGR